MNRITTTKKDARAKVGDVIMIDGFVSDSDGSIPMSEQRLIGKTGTVTRVGGIGEIHGTWGGISLLPEDHYHVIREA